VVWGRLRAKFDVPPADHHSFAEHDAILTAVADRDGPAAREAMQAHLITVRNALFGQ
jgi:DNA-binding FadR family transcriptional regulator